MTRIGSLFSGAGGLDMAVETVFNARTVWQSEIDPAASTVLKHHWPHVPNLGDITTIDWNNVEPVEILCGGFPCTDVSVAGKRAGMHDTRSGLWSHMAEAINVLRPQYVIIENVRGLLNADANRPVEPGQDDLGNTGHRPVLRAAGAVFGDLADIGTYDVRWATVAAADIGAPHQRLRVFIIATHTDADAISEPFTGVPPTDAPAGQLLPTPRSSDRHGAGLHGQGGMDLKTAVTLLPTPRSRGAKGGDSSPNGGPSLPQVAINKSDRWGNYAAAISRWETSTSPAPPPTEPNKHGRPRLRAAFAEWMMGWPAGWVTDPKIGISRTEQLRIIGNGVCPQQAEHALKYLLNTHQYATAGGF